jgi:aspartyl-tRNA(Asn)/glutamyl-tRNA(Gln) amidotransferase subunit C
MVDTQDVERVAENARIELEDEEKQQFVEEFKEILDVFESIQNVDTEDTEPSFHPVDVEPDTREDVEGETLSKKEVFANTNNEEKGMFKGPSA